MHSLLQTQVSVLSGQVSGVADGVPGRAAVGNNHSAVVSVHAQARRRAARRHDDEHRDPQLHRVKRHRHREAGVRGHDHTLPLLILEQHTVTLITLIAESYISHTVSLRFVFIKLNIIYYLLQFHFCFIHISYI